MEGGREGLVYSGWPRSKVDREVRLLGLGFIEKESLNEGCVEIA